MRTRFASLFLFAGLALFAGAGPAGAAEAPPIEVRPRDLRLETMLIREGRPAAAIVIPDVPSFREQAARINAALAPHGVELPVELDQGRRDIRSLDRNLIILGDRDSNLALKKLYYLHYTLLDARFPGPGGSDLRSLHDPFGDGFNIITVGAMDSAGLARAVDWLVAEIARLSPRGGSLALGRLQRTEFAKGTVLPETVADAIPWERSDGYGRQTHFGWNILSRLLATYYMTGDEKWAREFMRLAVPDEQGVKDILAIDRENFDDPRDPLVKPYHYDAIMMMIYWDLVEESPVFPEDFRALVTQKFADQFAYHVNNTYKVLRLARPDPVIGGRHELWELMSAYVIARYFDKYSPGPATRRCLEVAEYAFHAFDKHLAMRLGTLYWYGTYIEPAFIYAALSDPLRYEDNAVVREYAATLGRLSDRTKGGWATEYASPFFLNLTAALTNDQGYADLVGDTRQATDIFRIGQSYWPARPYPRNYFKEVAGTVQPQVFDPEAMGWKSDFPKEEVMDFVSYRQFDDARGDFLLIDSKYESGRNPFHNFALINLRIDGQSLLRGYGNQLHVYRDGLFASDISRFTRVTGHVRVGGTLVVHGEVRDQNRHAWSRTFLLRENSHLIVIDRVTALTDTRESQIDNDWESSDSVTAKPAGGEFLLAPKAAAGARHPAYTLATSLPADVEVAAQTKTLQSSGVISRFQLRKPMKKGETLAFASVLRPGAPDAANPSAGQDGEVVALRLPRPAILSLREGQAILAEEGRVFAHQVSHVPGLLTSDRPVTVDYDRGAGRLCIHAAATSKVRLLPVSREVAVPAGETLVVELADAPLPLAPDALAAQAERILRDRSAATAVVAPEPPALKRKWQAKGSSYVHSIVPIRQSGKTIFAVADGSELRLLDEAGAQIRSIPGPATIGAIHWWAAKGLLLVGARDDSLRAVDLDGTVRWSFKSEMAPELVESRKFYWFKSSIPGVIALETFTRGDGREFVFVGGAGTVEIIDDAGKLERRFWQTWGAVDGFALQPAQAGKPAAMLCKRSMGGDPYIYEVSHNGREWTQRLRRIVHSIDGTNLGGLGFSMVGRNFLRVDRLTPDGPLQMIGDFNGAQNRLVLWDLEGKPQKEADLGPGFVATGVLDRTYGRSITRDLNVRGLELIDLDGDKRKEIVVALDRRLVIAFDQDLSARFLVRTAGRPVLMRAISAPSRRPLLVVAEFDGRISVIDAAGRIVAGAKVGGTPTMLLPDGDQVLVGNDRGELSAFELPR